jgi:hypothetical protein
MKNIISHMILAGMLLAHTATGGESSSSVQSGGDAVDNISSTEDLTQAEYLSETFECTVMEVATQHESPAVEVEFHCLDHPDDPHRDGKVFELEGLPPEFEQTYRSQFTSGQAKLRASKIYRSGYRLIFTNETIWSITED